AQSCGAAMVSASPSGASVATTEASEDMEQLCPKRAPITNACRYGKREPAPNSAVDPVKHDFRRAGMLEFGVAILVLAVMMTLVTDALSGTAKMLRATQRREKIRVAEKL